jgi:hypothetical protein
VLLTLCFGEGPQITIKKTLRALEDVQWSKGRRFVVGGDSLCGVCVGGSRNCSADSRLFKKQGNV